MMGGGGGIDLGWPKGGASADEILRKATKAEEKTSYEGEVNVYLQDLLADFNNRKQDQIDAHVKTIEDALNKENIGSLTLTFGGSLKKHTYVDGLSDVDILAKIDSSLLADKLPAEVLNYFAQRIKQRLPQSEVRTGNLAVTVRFSDGLEIQILPAARTATGIRIAASDGKSWSNVINPEKFAEKLTNVNKNNNNGVVPVIKLYKAINNQLPEDAKLSGYHIESIAINAFRYYEGEKSRKSMLMHLCKFASDAVLQPIKDNTGQSIHVDDKLGAADSFERQKASANIRRVANKMKLADSEASTQGWKELFGE